MKWWERKKHKEEKEGKKRFRIGLLVILILAIVIFGGLAKSHLSIQGLKEAFWQERKIVRPIPEKNLENELVENLQESGIEIVSLGAAREDQIESSISGGIRVIFPTKNLREKIASLQLMLQRFKIEGRLPKSIDLRFEKPVVKF